MIIKIKKYIYIALFSAIAIVFIVSGCNKAINDTGETISIDDIPDIIITDFQDNYVNGTNKIWILKAKQAKIFEKRGYSELDEIRFISYASNKINSKITAKYGDVRRDRRNNIKEIIAKTNVVVKAVNGTVLYSDYLVWNEKRGKLFTDTYVKIEKPDGYIIKGYGFESDRDLTEIVIIKSVGEIYDDEIGN